MTHSLPLTEFNNQQKWNSREFKALFHKLLKVIKSSDSHRNMLNNLAIDTAMTFFLVTCNYALSQSAGDYISDF